MGLRGIFGERYLKSIGARHFFTYKGDITVAEKRKAIHFRFTETQIEALKRVVNIERKITGYEKLSVQDMVMRFTNEGISRMMTQYTEQAGRDLHVAQILDTTP